MEDEYILIIPDDLQHLTEAQGGPVVPSDPDAFVDQIAQQAVRFRRSGQETDADDFRLAMGGEIAEPEVAPQPEQPPEGQIAEPPQPTQPEAEYISVEDERKFISYLRKSQRSAYDRQREETARPDSDQRHLAALTGLLSAIDQFNDQYEQPGVITTRQHEGNVRRLNRLLHDVRTTAPRQAPEPAAAEQPAAAPEPEAEPAPEAPAQPREAGKFGFKAKPEDIKRVADLLTNPNKTPEEAEALRDERQKNPKLIRAALRFIKSERPVESALLDDAVLKILFEAEAAVAPEMQTLGRGDWLRIYPEPENKDLWLDVYTDVEGGWTATGIVKAGPTPAPQAPQEPQPQAEKPQEPERYEDDRTRRIDQALMNVKDMTDPAKIGQYTRDQLEVAKDQLTNLWRKINVDLDLSTKRPDLRRNLQAEIDNLRDAAAKAKPAQAPAGQVPAEQGVAKSASDTYLLDLHRTAKWQRTDKSGWRPWGIKKTLSALIGTNARVVKSRENKKGTEIKVISPKGTVYFWVPIKKSVFASQQDHPHVKLPPLLESILGEQEFDARFDPKGEAPEDAFGAPPIPPEGSRTGLAQEPPLPGEEPEPGGPAPERPRKPNRIVVTQNGVWWEMAWDNWLQLLAQGASSSRWNLDHWGARIPDGQPVDVREYITGDEGPTKYYSTDPSTNVNVVKDWSPKRFGDELNYVQAMDVAGMSLVSPNPPEEEPAILSQR